MDTNHPIYRKAFIQYLRRGTPIEIFLKAEAEQHPTTHYIWRTRGDDKVRGSHAANDGHLFAWDNPPPTGHPGEEYGCRCWAEPYYEPSYIPEDLPLEPIYPEFLLPVLGIGRRAILLAIRLISQAEPQITEGDKPENLTDHGLIRWEERRITQQETAEAIRTAKQTGNIITTLGKYGTTQFHYIGSNGITVVVETEGRNAGKIITYWRN